MENYELGLVHLVHDRMHREGFLIYAYRYLHTPVKDYLRLAFCYPPRYP